MAMPDKASVVTRLKEKPVYLAGFRKFYGENIFDDTEAAYAAMAESIAAFEKTDFFAPFDSKYDRYLRGEYKLSPREDLGMTLFFSQQFSNADQGGSPAQGGDLQAEAAFHPDPKNQVDGLVGDVENHTED